MISIISLFLFTGCSRESSYTTEEATTMMKEYIKEYYDEYGLFIINNKLIFDNIGLDNKYYFVAILDK